MNLEYNVESRLAKAVTNAGGFSRKYMSPGYAGVPDRIVFLNGVHFVELKRPKGGKISRLQEKEHAWMAKQGVPVHVIHNSDDIAAFIKEITNGKDNQG